MTQLRTDLNVTWESARSWRSEPYGFMSATNVQAALQQLVNLLTTFNPTPVTAAASPYAVQGSDTLLLVDSTAGPVTINLMSAAARGGLPLVIKDIGGNAATNNITINRNLTDTIDSLTSVLIATNYYGYSLLPIPGGWGISP